MEIPQATLGAGAANTLTMVVEMFWSAMTAAEQKYMHLKCWKESGRYGRWVKPPETPIKCDHCHKTIAKRDSPG